MTETSVSLQIRPIEPGEWPALVRMYETFEPKRASFGLPPLHPEEWLTEIRSTSHNLVVIFNGEIVGHGMICQGGRGRFTTSDGEFALFIHQDFRGKGLGRKLLEALIAEARRLGVRLLWGVEETDNEPLFRLTEALGFGGGRYEGMVYLRLAPEGVVASLKERRVKERRRAV